MYSGLRPPWLARRGSAFAEISTHARDQGADESAVDALPPPIRPAPRRARCRARHAAVASLGWMISCGGAAPAGPGVPSIDQPQAVASAATMTAVRIHGFGGPEVLQSERVPLPVAGAGELRIHVIAAGVNPVDVQVRDGSAAAIVHDRFPFTPGADVSGIVDQVGSGVTRFKVGDPVYAFLDLSRSGGYAEYAVAEEREAAPKPSRLTHVQAAAVPLAALTAWQALVDTAQLTVGQTVLIHGGSGGVGSFAIQIAKARGARVIATASTANQALLTTLGADQAIDYGAARFEDVAHDVDVVLDTVGGDTLSRSLDVVKHGGVVVTLRRAPDPAALAARHVRGGRIVVHPDAAGLAELTRLIDAGKITPVVSDVIALSDVANAHARVATGHTRGKIVLRVYDEP